MDNVSVRRFTRHFSIPMAAATVLALAPVTGTYADPYPLYEPAAVSEVDLRVVTGLLGIRYQRFDVEVDRDFCIGVRVEVTTEGEANTQSPWEHCSRAGPHRLMVVMHSIEEHSVVVHTALHDSVGMGTRTGSGPIAVPSSTWGAGHLRGPNGGPPTLAEGERTVIADFEYGGRAEVVGIRVHAELLPNPTGAIGSGPSAAGH